MILFNWLFSRWLPDTHIALLLEIFMWIKLSVLRFYEQFSHFIPHELHLQNLVWDC